jgi:hypothetical protein
MSGISVGRVVIGGLVAGLIINIVEFLVNGLFLEQAWADVMRSLGKAGSPPTGAQIAMFNAWGFAMGIVAVWLYAAIRPRFGPGPKTAVIAAVALWVPGYVLSMIPPVAMDLFPASLMLIGVAVGLAEIILGTIAGAKMYIDNPAAASARAAKA